MGLDISHDCWHGAYSAFNRFRNELALAAGYTLVRAEIGEHVDLAWDRFEEKNLQGDWETPPDDPLLILLAHSDCDGRIPAEYCEHLANRMEQIVARMPTEGAGHMPNPQEAASRFIAGLRLAAQHSEDVEFY